MAKNIENMTMEELVLNGYSFKDIQKLYNEQKKKNEEELAKKAEIEAARKKAIDAVNEYLDVAGIKEDDLDYFFDLSRPFSFWF